MNLKIFECDFRIYFENEFSVIRETVPLNIELRFNLVNLLEFSSSKIMHVLGTIQFEKAFVLVCNFLFFREKRTLLNGLY